ncbi:MAG: transcriptional repressor [Halanaerobiales bacterium]|nr:transcriptional repressor [Halanaerobiales bacterium]
MTKSTSTRMTKQRQAILNVLRSTTSHPTADWVYEEVRKIIPNISLGTVYRNLGILKNMGKVFELNFGSTYSRYDGNPENHYHFCCSQCGKVYDLNLPLLDSITEEAEIQSGHKIQNHRLEFYGICNECMRSPKN